MKCSFRDEEDRRVEAVHRTTCPYHARSTSEPDSSWGAEDHRKKKAAAVAIVAIEDYPLIQTPQTA